MSGEQLPSNDIVTRLDRAYDEVGQHYGYLSVFYHAIEEIEGLRRQVETLSVELAKWVNEAQRAAAEIERLQHEGTMWRTRAQAREHYAADADWHKIADERAAEIVRLQEAAQEKRNTIIRKIRERYSAMEIADIVGLTRQRVHQILSAAVAPDDALERDWQYSPAEQPTRGAVQTKNEPRVELGCAASGQHAAFADSASNAGSTPAPRSTDETTALQFRICGPCTTPLACSAMTTCEKR